MRKYLFTLGMTILILCFSSLAQADDIGVMVRDFYNSTAQPYYDMTASALKQELEKDYKKIKYLKVISSEDLDDKTALLLTRANNTYNSKELKKIIGASKGANILLLGTVKGSDKNFISINVKFLDTSTGKLVQSINIRGKEQDLHKIADKIVFQTIKVINKNLLESGSAVEMTPETKASVEKGKDTNYHAYLALEEVDKYLAKKDYKRALFKCEEVLHFDSKYIKIYETMGMINEKLKYKAVAFNNYNIFLSKSLKTLDDEQLMAIYYKMAQNYDQSKSFEASLHYYEAALRIEETYRDPQSLANKQYYVGVERYKSGDYKRALESLQDALKTSAKLNSKLNLARIYEAFGFIYLKTDEFDKSRSFYEKASAIYEGQNDRLRAAQVYNMLGVVYSHGNKESQALTFFGMSLDYWKSVGHKTGSIEVYRNMAQVYEKQDETDNALHYYQLGLENSEAIGDQTQIVLFHYLMSTLKEERRNRSQDLDILPAKDPKAIEDSRLLQNLATLFNNIGLYYQYKKNSKRALEYYVRAVNISEELGNKVRLESSYNNLGLMYLQENKFNNAFIYLYRAFKISEKSGDQVTLARRYHNIGAYYYKKKEYDKSLLTFKRCLKIRETIGDRLGYASTAYNIALVQVENNEKSEALKYINEAVDIERAYGSPKYKSSLRLLDKIDKMDLSSDTMDNPESGMENPNPDN